MVLGEEVEGVGSLPAPETRLTVIFKCLSALAVDNDQQNDRHNDSGSQNSYLQQILEK